MTRRATPIAWEREPPYGASGFRVLGATRTLDSHACRLRQKLSARGDRFVVNVWGVGYRLVDGEVTDAAADATAAALGEPS